MSYKKQILEKINNVLKDNKNDVNNSRVIIVSIIRDEFHQILQVSKLSGISLKHTVYTILEAVDEIMNENKLSDKELIFQMVTQFMVDIAYCDAKEKIHMFRSERVELNLLKEKIENEKLHLEDIADGFKEYVVENGYHILSKSVRSIQNATNDIKTDSFLQNS